MHEKAHFWEERGEKRLLVIVGRPAAANRLSFFRPSL